MSVRAVTAEDWAEWRLLRRQALAESPDAFSSTLEGWSGDGDNEQRWRQRLNEVPVNLIADDDDGVPVGMVSVTETANGQAEVISMWVAPKARGRGAGDALLRAAIARAETAGANRVALDVRLRNDHAVRLYSRAGFVDVGWATSPELPHPERRMELDLRQVGGR
jgi:ribosomal protein S18 acetylase RimI-like enzyme